MSTSGNPPPALEPWDVPDRLDIRVGDNAWKVFGAFWVVLAVVKVAAASWVYDPWDASSWVGRAAPTAALLVLWGALAAVAMARCAIAITPEQLIVRGLFQTRSFGWAEILTVNGGSSWITVTTRAGTFRLPWIVLATQGGVLGRSFRSYDSMPMLMGTIEAAWVQRRGAHWFSAPLDPWSPTRQFDEGIILRRPWAQWPALMVLVAGAVFFMSNYGAGVGGYLGLVLAASVGVATFGLVDHYVNALVITDDALVLRTVLKTRRIALVDIMNVIVEQGDAAQKYSLWGPSRRMLVQTSSGWVCLPAPMGGGLFSADDPLFLRKAAWLEHEVRGAAPVASDDQSMS